MDAVALVADLLNQVALMFAANEETVSTFCGKCIGKSQTAHDMTGTYMQGRVSAKNNFHFIQFKRLKPP